jgi:hypothetical protein
MENEKLIRIIENSFQFIDFVNRYQKIMENHSDFENRMQKVDKKEILKVLKELGYTFKVFSPGQDFYIEDFVAEYKFVFSFKCKSAIMENYIYVYYKGEKILYEENFAFIFRYLLKDINAQTTAPKFKTYNEFKEIIQKLLKIYEDFKAEFLKQVEKV